MNFEFDKNNLIFSLFSSLTIAAIIFLTGCTQKKKTAAVESLVESQNSKNSSKGGTAPAETNLPSIPEQPKERVISAKEEFAPPEEKKPDEVKTVEEQKVEEKKSEIKTSDDKESKVSAKVDTPLSKKSSKTQSKISEKMDKEDDDYVDLGPTNLPTPPKWK
uniref:Lipoprotein n=1 Tax=Panagrolaimus davidi TaxID=227884 RepID=A0A914PSC4_9BILA